MASLSKKLKLPLDTSVIVQSHTPFSELVHGPNTELKDKCVLVVGGDGNNCREVAERYYFEAFPFPFSFSPRYWALGAIAICGAISNMSGLNRYGFKRVVVPGDIFMANPDIWEYARLFEDYYKKFSRPLPNVDPLNPTKGPKIDAIFVFNDPRDWGLDMQVIVDLLLSSQGVIGTKSSKNNRSDLPNRGYQQDGQPALYFSNPDLIWAAAYHLPRLGQGAFREALEGVWTAISGGASKGVELKKTVIGKPSHVTYEYAERQLIRNRTRFFGDQDSPLKKVYMIGDNPESDIRGANDYRSCHGTNWHSILVRTGVYNGGEPSCEPRTICDNVRTAVAFGLQTSKWPITNV